MRFTEFLSDRAGRLMLGLVLAVSSALFLHATGTQAGVIILVLVCLSSIFAALQITDFLKLRSRFTELEAVMDGLDEKYLFAECLPPARTAYERRIFRLLRRSCKSMAGSVSDAEASRREYRDYIESWVHEIKAPITASRLICRNAEPEAGRKLLSELSQIEAHVERVLYYARVGNPEKDFLIQKTNLRELTAEAVGNYKSLLIQSGMRIETGDLDYAIYTDRKWSLFILGQLLQNAARYRGDAPRLTLSAEPSGNQVRLLVKDNGIGIPAHELPRIFDRGFTGSNGRSRGGSTGMGLYLCRKLAGILELELSITSEENRGTAVTLTFPAVKQGSEEPRTEGKVTEL